MSDPNDRTYDVFGPAEDQNGCAYTPVLGQVEAPDLPTAVEIATETYGSSHAMGEGGEGNSVMLNHSK